MTQTYFQIAQPIEKEKFLALYREVSLLTKLVFAPFGVHDKFCDIVESEEAVKIYSGIYQQLEDIVSKCLFKIHGYDDDQIVASMHHYVGSKQDNQVIK